MKEKRSPYATTIILKHIVATILILSLLFTSTSCSSILTKTEPTQTPVALAIVIGNRNCSAGPNLNDPNVQSLIKEPFTSNGYLSIIVCDGDPDIPCKMSLAMPDSLKHATEEKRAQEMNSALNSVLDALENGFADDEEADVLEALFVAVDSLSSCPAEMTKKILVLDSGLSTSGVLDFRNNLLNADTDAIVNALSERHNIPDLTGITVEWFGFGNVRAPQEPLSHSQENHLKEIWDAIITKGGGTPDINKGNDNPVFEKNDLPYVSPVILTQEAPLAFDFEPCSLEEDTLPFQEPVFLDEERVRFEPDSDSYVDYDLAVTTLKPIADYLIAHPGFQILLIGATAGDSNSEYSRALSYRRANAVKASLAELGASPSQITAIGLGSQDPWHISGAGTGSDPLASSNRKVVILDADTEIAQKLLMEGGDNNVE